MGGLLGGGGIYYRRRRSSDVRVGGKVPPPVGVAVPSGEVMRYLGHAKSW